MAHELNAETAGTSDHSDSTDHLDAIAAKYEKLDAEAAASAGSGQDENDDDDDAGSSAEDDESDDDDEHPGEDTSSGGRDGDDEDSSNDSDDDPDAATDDDEDEDQSTDSATDDADDAVGTDDDDEVDAVSPETRKALERNGADLKLEDVPEQYRPIVEKKIRAADVAFTRTMQELSTFRTEQNKFRADEQYRTQHADLVIVEMLRAGGEALLTKVNEHWAKLNPDEESGVTAEAAKAYNAALDKELTDAKTKVSDSITAEDRAYDAAVKRAEEVETYGRAAALKAGIPFGNTLMKAIALAVEERDGQRTIENATIDKIVQEFAADWKKDARSTNRQHSQERVKDRTNRRNRPAATVRASAGDSPRVAANKLPKGDLSDEEYRHKRMMATARRLIPGARDE